MCCVGAGCHRRSEGEGGGRAGDSGREEGGGGCVGRGRGALRRFGRGDGGGAEGEGGCRARGRRGVPYNPTPRDPTPRSRVHHLPSYVYGTSSTINPTPRVDGRWCRIEGSGFRVQDAVLTVGYCGGGSGGAGRGRRMPCARRGRCGVDDRCRAMKDQLRTVERTAVRCSSSSGAPLEGFVTCCLARSSSGAPLERGEEDAVRAAGEVHPTTLHLGTLHQGVGSTIYHPRCRVHHLPSTLHLGLMVDGVGLRVQVQISRCSVDGRVLRGRLGRRGRGREDAVRVAGQVQG